MKGSLGEVLVRFIISRGNKHSGSDSISIAGGQIPDVCRRCNGYNLHVLLDLRNCNLEIFLKLQADGERIYLRFIMQLALEASYWCYLIESLLQSSHIM